MIKSLINFETKCAFNGKIFRLLDIKKPIEKSLIMHSR